ncbi:MAG TPA: 50S ribosomal protein L13 [Phycisphaerae bacterium]|nr:50S ribosomal protein L13 [Phycisphaerae bacterium]
MSSVTDKCYQAKPNEVKREWWSLDADGQVLGRMATRLATVLMGKHKPTYTPHVDTGDFIVVTNAEKFKLTGNKSEEMEYDRYSYYPGGRRVVSFREMMQKHPERVIQFAVRRMLPKSAMGRRMLTKLKIYKGTEHPHQAQQCKALDLKKIR